MWKAHVNRTELLQLAEDRLLDAQALLAAQRWSAAYYLAGYAVECGLKACILAYVEATGVIFQVKRYSEECWTHDFEKLVRLAGIDGARNAVLATDPAFALNWQTTKDWDEASRYQVKTHAEAQELYNAVTDATHGVLPWIKRHW